MKSWLSSTLVQLRKLPLKVFRFLSSFIAHPILRYVILFILAVTLIGMGFVLQELPSPRRLTSKDNYSVSTLIFDRNGTQLYEIFADENRVPIKLEELPPHVAQATIAIEDKKFYRHFGFDILGIIRAARNNLSNESVEGGSTITQQLVKNALLSKEKTFTRKFKELVLSIFTEILYTKKQILEMYLNYISYGGTAVGIEAASKQYFNKSAKELSVAEAALLVGLPQAPSRYSPFASDATAYKNRQAEVLRRMVEEKYITAEQAEQAKQEKLVFALDQTDIKAPHFVFYVRDLLYEKYGVETVEKGGLRVHTTLDLGLQQAAQASLSAEVTKLKNYRVSNGAALVIKPNTGEILAMIGSKDYFDDEIDGKVNVTIRERQPGSSIKPLMYATAFQQKKLNPGSILLDVPTCFKVPGQADYCPKNYDGSFKGPVTIRRSLGNSLNIPAVKGLYLVGVPEFMAQATDLGITSWTDPSRYGYSLTLGGGEVRMVDLAQAFSTLANEGVKVPITPILKVEDYTGEVLDEVNVEQRKADLRELNEFEDDEEGDLRRVMDQAPAYLVSHILQDNIARTEAFGARSELVIPNQVVSVKTGTTNDLKDNWTIGYTPEYLVATWVGNNDSTPMNQALVSGITGAAPIWHDIMSFVLEGKQSSLPEKPGDVAGGKVCASGMPPKYSKEACTPLVEELYWTKSQPTRSTMTSKDVWIRPETGLPPNEGEVVDGLQLQMKNIYQDPLTDLYCNDCVRPVNESGDVQYERRIVNQAVQEKTEQKTETSP
jgi:1A family penicillin-binding protein